MPHPSRTFKISSALKTIIGRELITNDFVAVFELVKNAFDAHAKKVEIRFEGLSSGAPKLVIKDNGKGMTGQDISEKWLFLAYSAKLAGTEDDPTGHPQDYRDKIRHVRTFAGSKGIGRFSCDRLGRYLDLYTRAQQNGPYEHVHIDWQDFEKNSKKEFKNVRVARSTETVIPYDLKTGTVLEISGLREKWSRERLKELRNSLRKLINPNQENDPRGFNVELIVPEEQQADQDEEYERDRVNGRIKNFLFEELGLKATEIHCEIDEHGETITTKLTDRGTLIYRLVEHNPFPSLQDIRVHLFALNRAAKMHFHKVMGVHNVEYGSVFLYKNGFRIHPIGEEGDDRLGLDRRKQQGTQRYLGTRDLSGRIEITGDNTRFKEVSSRDAGLIDSPEWRQLLDFFYDYALKRLERYAVDVIKWGNPPKGSEEELQPQDVRAQILELINKLTVSHDVIDLEYEPKLLEILAERQSASVTTALSQFKRIAQEQNNARLMREVTRAERRLEQLSQAKEEAQAEAIAERRARALTEKQLATERQKNIFLLATAKDPKQQQLSLQHWVGIAGQEMRGNISAMVHKIKKGEVDREELLKALSKLQLWIDQVVSVSRLVTKADFNLQYQSKRMDLGRFIFEYLNSDLVLKTHALRFEIANQASPFTVLMRPIEITILLDNLVSNAVKARARKIRFTLATTANRLTLTVANDGEPVPKHLVDSMFELGVSGRGGSGIGLYTCQEIVTSMGGQIAFAGNDPELGGAAFEIVFFA